MYNSKLAILIFIVVAATQLYVPAKMIIDRESILTGGKEYKFKTAPVDPSDPFRGKYITLSFAANTVRIQDKNDWNNNETVYVLVAAGDDGFAKIDAVTKQPPTDKRDYIKAKVGYVNFDSTLTVEYPFERYYMEESKASGAESAYRESNRDTAHSTYAAVKISEGDAVLKDVFIDGVSIKEIVKDRKPK